MQTKLAIGLAIIVLSCLNAPAHAQSTPTIIVTGRGRFRAKPEFAALDAIVSTRAESLALAAKRHIEAARRAKSALDKLKTQGVAIKSSDFTLDRQSAARPPGGQSPPRKPSYVARTIFHIKITPATRLPSAVTALASDGFFQIGPTRFGINDRAGALDKARKSAVEDARRQAQTYALAAGMVLGNPIKITGASADFFPSAPRLAMQASASGTLPIAPPPTIVFANTVTVVWTMAPK